MVVMTARMTVRRGLSVEADEIREVVRAANEEFREAFPASMYPAYLANAMDVEARRLHGTVLVATADDVIVGTITHYDDANDEGMPIRFAPGTAGLRATAVRPDMRGLGLGRALVQAVIDRAIERGADAIALHTADAMRAATALYLRAGFVRRPDHDYPAGEYFVHDGAEDVMARAYVLDLRAASEGEAADRG